MTTQLLQLATVILTLSLFGCATTGRKFDTEAIRQLKEGVSTPADAERLLGPPYTTRREIDGSEHWTWFYAKTNFGFLANYNLSKSKTQKTQLEITFRNGTMSDCLLFTYEKQARGMYASQYGLGEGTESTIQCSEIH